MIGHMTSRMTRGWGEHDRSHDKSHDKGVEGSMIGHMTSRMTRGWRGA